MFYIIDINRPCVFYERHLAEDEIKTRLETRSKNSKERQLYGGTFIHITNEIYVYKFGETIPAKGAKISDFPTPPTSEILPPARQDRVNVDLDIAVVPRAKIRKMAKTTRNAIKIARDAISNSNVAEAKATLDSFSGESLETENPNEDDVSENANEDDVSENANEDDVSENAMC